MFETSYFDRLQDYMASGGEIDLNDEEFNYYNMLHTLIGIERKYGKDNAVSFLRHEPFNCTIKRAREMYSEAINLFYCDDKIEREAMRQMMYEEMKKAAKVALTMAESTKDLEVYGNLMIQAWKVRGLDKNDSEKIETPKEKPIKIYSLDTEKIGLPQADRYKLASLIDSIPDIPEREKVRLKRDAQVEDINVEEMLDDTEKKTKSY